MYNWLKNRLVEMRIKRMIRREMEVAKAEMVTKLTADMDKILGISSCEYCGLLIESLNQLNAHVSLRHRR